MDMKIDTADGSLTVLTGVGTYTDTNVDLTEDTYYKIEWLYDITNNDQSVYINDQISNVNESGTRNNASFGRWHAQHNSDAEDGSVYFDNFCISDGDDTAN